MPTYDFICEHCKHSFEKMNSITNRALPEGQPCPKCGAMEVKKIMSASGVVPDAVRLGRKPVDGGFQEVLAKIHENTPGSNLNEMLSRNPNKYRI